MRKLIAFLLLLTFCNLQLWSKQIDQNEAKQIAVNFINSNFFTSLMNKSILQLNLAYIAKNESVKYKRSYNQKYYYVYNIGTAQGFIIISADDINYPIIGYSKSGYYDINNLPENFQSWMRTVELGMQQAFNNSTKASKEIQREWELYRNSKKIISTRMVSLEPLIKTKWNQSEPYNSQIPYKVYTGCVATAIAQIMKFYQYPKSGIGKIPAYKTKDPSTNQEYNIPEIDLQQYVYNWTNMLDEYKNFPKPNYTKDQEKAIGLLMYHIGASAKMEYGVKESGAISEEALKALYTYYDYDQGIDYIIREKYLNEILISDDEWEDIIIKELNKGRPIYYRGSTDQNMGHAFVCDGYDSNGLLHFNFGWGGYQDGYYNSNAPLKYKYKQGIGINIKPNQGGEKVHRYFVNDFMISKNKVYKNECFTEKHNLYNIGIENFINYENLYLALYDLNGNMITLLNESVHLASYNNYYTINSAVKSGKYRLKIVEKKGDKYIPIKTAKNVEDNNMIEILEGSKFHNLSLRNEKVLSSDKSKAQPKDYLKVEFSFGNSLCKPFKGMIALTLTDEKDELRYILEKKTIDRLQEGYFYTSYSILGMIPEDISSGEYRIRIFARENESQEWQILEGAEINYLPLTIINGKLGVEDLNHENNQIIIYPNPVKNILYIKNNSEQKHISISIYDFSGKEVIKNGIINSFNGIDVSQLSPGSYIIKILTTKKEVKKYKFIKK